MIRAIILEPAGAPKIVRVGHEDPWAGVSPQVRDQVDHQTVVDLRLNSCEDLLMYDQGAVHRGEPVNQLASFLAADAYPDLDADGESFVTEVHGTALVVGPPRAGEFYTCVDSSVICRLQANNAYWVEVDPDQHQQLERIGPLYGEWDAAALAAQRWVEELRAYGFTEARAVVAGMYQPHQPYPLSSEPVEDFAAEIAYATAQWRSMYEVAGLGQSSPEAAHRLWWGPWREPGARSASSHLDRMSAPPRLPWGMRLDRALGRLMRRR